MYAMREQGRHPGTYLRGAESSREDGEDRKSRALRTQEVRLERAATYCDRLGVYSAGGWVRGMDGMGAEVLAMAGTVCQSVRRLPVCRSSIPL